MAVSRVAVVGAGAAGLCALKHVTARPMQAVCFELSNRVGGTWSYTDQTGVDENGLPVHSSMYKNLRTNLPKEAMAFPHYPFPEALKDSFIRHQEVQEYLESYAEHYDLNQHIKLSTVVNHVKPVMTTDNKLTWDVSYSSVKDKSVTETQNFDAVMVCNGHYSVPMMPNIRGLDSFQGEVLHSHNYRYPETFKGKRVVCLGAGASGQDIAIDMSSTANMVYISHRKQPLETYLPDNVAQKPGIAELKANSVIFTNGEEAEIDALLLCTGYKFDFPFLSKSCNFQINEERLSPLYKHMIHIDYPTLCFIGMVKLVCPFPMFDCQVRFFLATLDGTFNIPSKEEMISDTEADFQKRLDEGMPVRHAHTMGKKQWAYNDELADLAKSERVPRVIQSLFDYVHATRIKDIARYKSARYELTGPETYRRLQL